MDFTRESSNFDTCSTKKGPCEMYYKSKVKHMILPSILYFHGILRPHYYWVRRECFE